MKQSFEHFTNFQNFYFQVVCISQDSFYRDLTAEEKQRAKAQRFNFDHPDAFDENLMLKTLIDILDGKKVKE